MYLNKIPIKAYNKDLILYQERFNSMNEFIDINDTRTNNFGQDFHEDGEDLDEYWRGVKSYAEARELLKTGYDKPLNDLKARVQKIDKRGYANKPILYNDVHGFMPIVPNAILGIPQSMINNRFTPKKAKIVNILADCGVNSNISQEELEEFMTKIVEKIYALEQSGFRVKLDYMASFNGREHDIKKGVASYILTICIKNEYQPLDLKRILYTMTHVSMFRVLAFDWYQRVPNATHFSNLGCALYNCQHRPQIEEALKKENQYKVTYTDNIDEIFKGVK